MENKQKRYIKLLVILIALLIILLMSIAVFASMVSQPSETAVILPTSQDVHDADATGTIRISVEPSVTIKNGTMQDLNFFNTNENRLMSIKLYTQEGDEIKDLVYDSPKIKTGMAIAGDFIDTSKLTKGKNKAVAEVYYYDTDENLIGQTNVKDISLLYES